MSKMNSLVPGGCFPRPLPSTPGRLDPKPLPYPPPGRPGPLPHPLPGGLDQFMTKTRSAQLANTQGQQLDRIQQGVATGTVSEKEAAQLLDQQARIAKEIARAQSDGVVTSEEQAKIRGLQMGASLGIHQATSSRELSSLGRDRASTQAQAQQVGQIADGIRSGELTGREASVLLRDQANISRDMVNARADGKIDLSERLRLGKGQAEAGRDIKRESRDFEKAPHARPMFHILPVRY